MIPNNWIKNLTTQVGFSDCGITSPKILTNNKTALEQWTLSGFNGEMKFLEQNNHIRENILNLYPETKSIIVCLLNYKQEEPNNRNLPIGKVSHYALGIDYHFVIKDKLNNVLGKIQEKYPEAKGIAYTDSAPIFEKEYAKAAGLGWAGKNTLLLHPKMGSFFFIGMLLINLPIENDEPFLTDHCGKCTACIDACPTQAIQPDRFLDARKCISYLTIEKKSSDLDENLTTDGWVFGCDICQEVCPWNIRFSPVTQILEFKPIEAVLHLTKTGIESLSENSFRKKFRDSPLSRRGRKGLLRNLGWIEKQP